MLQKWNLFHWQQKYQLLQYCGNTFKYFFNSDFHLWSGNHLFKINKIVHKTFDVLFFSPNYLQHSYVALMEQTDITKKQTFIYLKKMCLSLNLWKHSKMEAFSCAIKLEHIWNWRGNCLNIFAYNCTAKFSAPSWRAPEGFFMKLIAGLYSSFRRNVSDLSKKPYLVFQLVMFYH